MGEGGGGSEGGYVGPMTNFWKYFGKKLYTYPQFTNKYLSA